MMSLRKHQYLFLIFLFFICIFPLTFDALSQKIIEEAKVINVEVPVRVYKGTVFVNDLTIDDFEVYENGVPQKIEGVYLVKKKTVERSEEKKRFAPETSRTFYLVFEITEFTSKLGDAIDYFYHKVYIPGDTVIISTPLKTYRLNPEIISYKPPGDLVKELRSLLIHESYIENSNYLGILKQLEQLAQTLSSYLDSTIPTHMYKNEQILPFEKLLMKYSGLLSQLESLRRIDQERLLNFASYLKNKTGRKYVFLFYHREFVPKIESRLLSQLMSQYQDNHNILRTASRLFESYNRDIDFDVNLVKQAFADSSIAVHFLLISRTPRDIPGVVMEEQSDDVFGAFQEMARASGGFVKSSANPAYLFREAVEASENYYLVYYSPKNYKKDNSFKRIEVKVKNKDYTVKHRLGYYAD